MTESDIYKELELIFREVFEDTKLEISANTNNSDISGWTSLTHAILITEIEKKLDISFEIQDMLSMHSVSDIVNKVAEKKQ